MEAAVNCLDQNTFNLSETIKSNFDKKWNLFLDMEKEIWTEDLTNPDKGFLLLYFDAIRSSRSDDAALFVQPFYVYILNLRYSMEVLFCLLSQKKSKMYCS